jgi:hypothetical protein
MTKKPQTREERLALALRENLKRRKAQARGKKESALVNNAKPETHDQDNQSLSS